MDQKIIDNVPLAVWTNLQNSKTKNLIKLEDNFTFNDYFVKNNISPEDDFQWWWNTVDEKVFLPGTQTLLNTTSKSDLTYVWPAQGDSSITLNTNNIYRDYIQVCVPRFLRPPLCSNQYRYSPSFFTRLSVGKLPEIWIATQRASSKTWMFDYSNDQRKLGNFSRDTHVFPNIIGYGEDSTVNDYMLTNENSIVIPARYNQLRDDVTLTLRWRADFFAKLNWAKVYLNAVDSRNNTAVSWNTSGKYFLSTTSNIYINETLVDSLWSTGRSYVRNFPNISKNTLTDISIPDFVTNINSWLNLIEKNSWWGVIAGGNWWQVHLKWMYRDSFIDWNFLSSLSERLTDSTHHTDVEYYMYSTTKSSIEGNMPIAPNKEKLYSPNISTFKIETTRPYFSDFGDLSGTIVYSGSNFDNLLGSGSFKINDNGILTDGAKVGTDSSRVKVRISTDSGATFSGGTLSLSEFQNFLADSANIGKSFIVSYTYAATDSQDINIWKLPSEIIDNTGPYAVPFVRNIFIPKLSTLTVKYIDTTGAEISPQKTMTGAVGDNFLVAQDAIPGYTFKQIANSGALSGNFADSPIVVTLVYEKIINSGSVIAKFLDENGTEIAWSEQKVWEIGANYSFPVKNIDGYDFVRMGSGETDAGKFSATEQILHFFYKKKPAILPTNPSTWGGSGAGGPTPSKPITTDTATSHKPILQPVEKTPEPTAGILIDGKSIFHIPMLGGQCINIVKNLDEPRLVNYYHNSLDIAASRKVHKDVTRWEFVKMLILASGVNLKNTDTSKALNYADISLDNKYFIYIAFALNNGLIHGQTDGEKLYFRPSDTISRAEAAKIFIRAAGIFPENLKSIFADVGENMPLEDYIQAAYDHCLLHGRKTIDGHPIDGKPRVFEPYSPITIAETAKVLYNMTHQE